jgi:hypothetical protein
LKHIQVLLPLAAGFLWLSVAGAADTSSGKAPKDRVHYRLVGCNGRANCCMNCRFFKPAERGMCMGMMEARCQVVAGSVSPMGYCDLFVPIRPAA